MKTKILIVEDESIVAQDLQFILEDLDYDASQIANSGILAMQKVAEFQPDLILMDIRIIGDMDGIETAKAISQQYDIPIVYSTAHSDEDTLAKAKQTSPYGYIIKPFDERELRTVIEIALHKHNCEQQIKRNAHWLKTVLNSIGDGVITTDNQGRITFLNPSAEQLTGWSLEQALGKQSADVFFLIDATTRKTIEDPILKVLDIGKIFHLPQNVLLIKKDGQEIYVDDSVSPIVNQRGILPLNDYQGNSLGTVIIFRDVTQERLIVQTLHRKAFYDSLTNLPNRDWFNERLTDAVERVKRNPNYRFALLFLDLDRFKTINDSLGHPVGDKLLIAVSQRLLQVLRSFDTVARLGGDEFAIILENMVDYHESSRIAQRIIDELSKPFIIDGHEIMTSSSVGIVISSNNYHKTGPLIRDADIAMYRAKEVGGGCYELFDTKMRSQVIATSQLENELKVAIEENQLSQLIIHYQPIVALPDQEITGFEALVRWLHPKKGLISPAMFIPMAEETGLIIDVDLRVLKAACRQLKIWQQQNRYSSLATMSVNLSSRHFIESDCIVRIQEILVREAIDPKYIKLEITETTLIENFSTVATTLAALKALGIALSLDDFGTGYSSLSYLQQFPLDVLKIDRSFVRNVHQDAKKATIAKALIEIAHQLNLTVVAEGVETRAELAFLCQNKCDYVQGFFFSPPLASTDVELLELQKILL